MKATQMLHDLGQSLWLDNITRDLLDSGTLERYIDELSVTGLTSNPTIFDHAIKNSVSYDAAIRQKVKEGKAGEPLFFELALEDLTRAADLFRPIWDKTNGVDGWVSLEVSPLLAYDTASTLAAALAARLQRGRPPAAPAVGKHGDEGPSGLRRPLRQGARRAAHREHHAGGHAEGPRRPRRARRDPAGRRRRLRGRARPVRQGRGRRRRAGRPAPGRGREILREFLARAHGGDRLQECQPPKGGLGAV